MRPGRRRLGLGRAPTAAAAGGGRGQRHQHDRPLVALWALQVLSGDKYLAQATQNRVRTIQIDAPRGVVLDRYGHVLVSNVAGTSFEVWPADLPKTWPAQKADLKALAAITGGLLLLALAFIFVSLVLPVLLAAGALAAGALWWRLRRLRRQMAAAAAEAEVTILRRG